MTSSEGPVEHLRDLLAARAGRATGGGVESLGGGAGPPRPDDVADAVADTFRRMLAEAPEEEIGDRRAYREAVEVLLRESRGATRALAGRGRITTGQRCALEAVVRTDGTRPSLFVRDDTIDVGHPMALGWAGDLHSVAAALADVARAVGRVEPWQATAHNYFGTAWVVDAEKALVLTNSHVLTAIYQALPHLVVRGKESLRILDGVYIDFARESGRDRANRFQVVEAWAAPFDEPQLDAAVLRISPLRPDQAVPTAVPARPDVDGPNGNLAEAFLLGFPGPPDGEPTTDDGVDWAQVYRTLFGNVYGVKRLAPAQVHRPVGTMPEADDPGRWSFGHDATTLGGSSGSPVLGWVDGVLTAFGLHYAGWTLTTNYAHAFSRSATVLEHLRVPLA